MPMKYVSFSNSPNEMWKLDMVAFPAGTRIDDAVVVRDELRGEPWNNNWGHHYVLAISR